MSLIFTTTTWFVRGVIVLLLIGWLLVSPLLVAASGLTLSDPANGSRLAVMFVAQAFACLIMLIALALWHRKALLWIAAGTLATWSFIIIA